MFKKLIQSKALRSRTAWLITAVLLLPFLLFFHFSGGPEGAAGGAAGTLFGKRVPWEQYEEQRRWVRLQWALQFGEIPASLEPMVDGYTWDRLLLVEAAKRERLGINDRELAGVLQNMPSFQDQGRFVPDRYYQFLSSLGMSPTSFERLIRQDLMVERLTARVGDRAQVTEAEVEQAYRDAEERRSLALLSWRGHDFEPSEASLTDEDIEAHYRAREDLVTRPGASTFETVGLTREQAAEGLTVEEEQIQRHYDAHPDEFTADGAVTPLADVRQQIRDRLLQDAAKRRLTALAVDVEAALGDGQAFEAVAATVALPIARHGPHDAGNLFLVGGHDPTVLQAAFALKTAGQLSDVVENDRGVHLIRLLEVSPERIPPLEEVRELIVHDLLHPRG
ncbi:MAG: SurA N-terminal domain-containing protein, partial [Dehalococcoidia bacterium]|nr:SurA N-terminal domain-containing protein [Dehalococcoidia bacterium]